MERRQYHRTARGLVAIDGAMSLIAVLLIVQMWLLTATLEGVLAGDQAAALPAAVVSGVISAASVGLTLLVNSIDRKTRGK